MGNCINPIGKQHEELNKEERATSYHDRKLENYKENKGGMKLKIMMTKEELEWLMYQLKEVNGSGNMQLEDVLKEIERGRLMKKVAKTWKPSLESILESIEGLEVERLS